MKPGLFWRLLGSLRGALPGWKLAIAGSLAWSAAMAASAAISLWVAGRTDAGTAAKISVLFALGGLIAFVPAATAAGLARAKGFESRLAAAFVALAVTSIATTAILYALQFRLYFSQWHDDPFSVRWLFEFAFTVAAAFYQFAVLGLRLYFPVGLIALFAASVWLAKRPR